MIWDKFTHMLVAIQKRSDEWALKDKKLKDKENNESSKNCISRTRIKTAHNDNLIFEKVIDSTQKY